jgi:hypothetical protein
MKGCHTEQTKFLVDSLESSEHNFRIESAIYDSASNALVLGGEEIHKVSEVRMGVVDNVECFVLPMVNTLPNRDSQFNTNILNPKTYDFGTKKPLAKRKDKRKTFWKLVKSAATIKFLIKEKDVEKAKPTFTHSLESKDERSIQMYADKIGSITAIMCENNPSTAVRALTKVLKSDPYSTVKVLFETNYMPVTKEIVSGIRSFVKDHSNLP